MFLNSAKAAIAIYCLIAVVACKPVYIVNNELSTSYVADRDFFSDKYDNLKIGNVLFYVEIGYFKEETNELVIFLSFDSLASGVHLTKSDLLLNGRVIGQTEAKNYSEEESVINSQSIYSGGSRLVFDISRIKELIGEELILAVYFENFDDVGNRILLELEIVRERIMPT